MIALTKQIGDFVRRPIYHDQIIGKNIFECGSVLNDARGLRESLEQLVGYY